jgi:hypothetical protein
MRNLLRLALAAGLLLPQAVSSQGSLPADRFVYGTYNIQTSGDSGPVTISPDGDPTRVQRDEREASSWQLTFYKSGTANMVKTHVTSWTHQLDNIQTFASGPTARTITETRTDYLYDSPDVTGSLSLQYRLDANKQSYRQLAMSDSDPTVEVKTTTIITNYDRNGKVIGTPDVRPAPGQKFPADHLIMHLVLAWQGAQWSNGYSGTLTVQNSYQDYVAPKTGYHWLTVKAQWNLQP